MFSFPSTSTALKVVLLLLLQETFGAMAKTEKIAYILEQVGGAAA
jgi:hypothetical protein